MVPWHEGDDLPVDREGRVGHQAAHLFHIGEPEHESASTHEGYLNDMAVLQVEASLKLIPDLCPRRREANHSPIDR